MPLEPDEIPEDESTLPAGEEPMEDEQETTQEYTDAEPEEEDQMDEELPAQEVEAMAEGEEEPAEESYEEEGEEVAVAAAGPDSEDGEPLLQPCSNCSTLLDVGELEPFAKVHCPICGTAMRVRTQLKNFTLVEVLGAGGMGAVYKALDTNLNRMVALKVVRKEFSSDREYLGKFEREARITASVTHPHVVKVYSFGSDHGLFYIAMELVDKGSLDDLMNLQGQVAEIQALGVGIQVAQGLQAAHQKGLIHRDVKPGNILFADAQTAKIVDFGLALLAEHEAEERGEVWGTPYYVAPEKLDHQPEDFRSDMYSLGGTLFHAIAGRPPFEADTASMVALKHLKSRAVSLQAFAPDVSSATAYVINRMLHKDPEQRYQSYAELVEHLEYAKAQLLESSGSPRRSKQRVVVESAGQQKVFGIITLVLILLLAGGIGVAAYYNWGRLFSNAAAGTVTSGGTGESSDAGGEQSAKLGKMHDRLDAARKQIISGDEAGALDALKTLDDDTDITQPFQNWITVHEGIAALVQENLPDAGGWFGVVAERSHYSSEPGDANLVNFFSKIGAAMKARGAISPGSASGYALDNEEALAPLLFALKDWNLNHFKDAGSLFGVYLSATPKDPFQWVGDYKPLAQQYADQEAAFEKAYAAATSAGTPDARADGLKQIEALQGKVKGKLAAYLAKVDHDLKRKNAALDKTYNDNQARNQQADEGVLNDVKPRYAAAVAQFSFDDAVTALQAATVITPDGIKTRDVLLKKSQWLQQFKAQLIKDVNAYGYPGVLVNRAGGRLPDGTKKASADGLEVQNQFGVVPFPWNSLPPAEILAIANYYTKTTAAAQPGQAPDREWMAGVFACEEGMPGDGKPLLTQAAQAKAEYQGDLGLFGAGS
jgi:hypothetical protein